MILRFNELASTSTYLKENLEGLPQFAVVKADFQTAGRGQRGNGWESEAGKNLLMSMLYFPPETLCPQKQFLISEAVALAVVEAVEILLGEIDAPEVTVKWPNDIYVGDKKLCGILIEHSLKSADVIAHTVIGIGLNVNQREFHSNAPNPTSLIHYILNELSVDDALDVLINSLKRNLSLLVNNETDIVRRYRQHLWRRKGFHPYISRLASSRPAPTAVTDNDSLTEGCRFDAEIVDVAPDGPLLLRLRSGEKRRFNFKEVVPII